MLCVAVAQHLLTKPTCYLSWEGVSSAKIAQHVIAQSLSSQAKSKPSWNGDEVRVKVEVVVTWKREKGYGKVCGGHGEEEDDGWAFFFGLQERVGLAISGHSAISSSVFFFFFKNKQLLFYCPGVRCFGW